MPVKIEICSGAGEWVVAQAKKDGVKARWIAMEIRHDRVYHIFTQALFDHVSNLCIIAGDASKAISTNLAPNLADFIFINQPEPPQQTGGRDSEGKHLLTHDFFQDCTRVLKVNGILTVVTDNKWYAQLLLKILSKVPGVGGVQLKTAVAHSINAFHVYMGHPPKECGVADVKSSSYFDRLAKQDSIRASQSTYFISVYRI